MAELPRGTVTFLFTDMEGSTRLWEEYPEQTRRAHVRHDAILAEAIDSHGGRVVKSTGDGVHAAFATAPEALSAALAAQRVLRAEPWPDPIVVPVRMGLH